VEIGGWRGRIGGGGIYRGRGSDRGKPAAFPPGSLDRRIGREEKCSGSDMFGQLGFTYHVSSHHVSLIGVSSELSERPCAVRPCTRASACISVHLAAA